MRIFNMPEIPGYYWIRAKQIKDWKLIELYNDGEGFMLQSNFNFWSYTDVEWSDIVKPPEK